MLTRRAVLSGGAAIAGALGLPAWARLSAVPPPTRESMVPVAGGRVYVRVNGDLKGAKPPVVFVHGGPGGTHASYVEALALADERAVILYDQLDCGRSDRPNDRKNWTVARFVSELDAIRTALGVARWHVCGHSWGGTLALEYGARARAALASTILASPLISTRSWIADADALRAQLPAEVRARLRVCDDPRAGAAACEAVMAPFYRAFNGREPPGAAEIAYARSVGGQGFNPLLYRTMWGASEFVATGTLRDYDGAPLLARLAGARTLFVCGQYDEARPVTTLGFAGRVAGAEVAVVPGAAHSLFGDRPDESVAIVRGWLARHDAVPV